MTARLNSLLVVLVLLLGACDFLAGKVGRPAGPLGDLVDKEWQLVEATVLENDSTIALGYNFYSVTFLEDGTGNMIDVCNEGEFFYQVVADSIFMNGGTATEMGCPSRYYNYPFSFYAFTYVDGVFSVEGGELRIEGMSKNRFLEKPEHRRMVFKEK
jgi:hypothetical protein